MSVQSDDLSPSEPASGVAPDGQSPDDQDTIRAELAELEQKADEYLRLAQRTQADFINYRRRIEEERAQQARDATVALLQKLFPILDDFLRAREHATPAEVESSWGQGVQLVERNLRSLLAAEGVDPIEAEGAEFDPRLHEAVGSQPSTDVPEGHL